MGVVGSGKSRAQGSAGMAGAEPEPESESVAVCLTEAADEDAEAVVSDEDAAVAAVGGVAGDLASRRKILEHLARQDVN